MKCVFSKRSLMNLKGLHPHLQAVAATAIYNPPHDFVVICGLRTIEEQRALVRTGKSWTMNSAHLTGYAFDAIPLTKGKIDWQNIQPFIDLGRHFMHVGDTMGVPLRWGGDWDEDGETSDERHFDGPHIELNKSDYDWHERHPPRMTIEEWGPDCINALTSRDGSFCAIDFADEPPQEQPEPATQRKTRQKYAGRGGQR